MNLSKSKLFGFVMSCMQLGDFSNEHSLADRRKAIRNMHADSHPKAIFNNLVSGISKKRIPSKVDSSLCVPILAKIVNQTMKAKKTKRLGNPRIDPAKA